MTQTIDQTLAERGARYGEFPDHAAVTQSIKSAMSCGNNWEFGLADDQKECLEMIAHKIGRILNGDPDYIDSWTDIIGYARLVEKRLTDEQTEPEVQEPKTDGLASFLAAVLSKAEVEADEDECTDPTCTTHNPELAKAIDVLRRAGVLIEH